MATLLPGHRDPDDEGDRAELARIWGIDALTARPGLTAVELFDACARGDIAALWIACTNPAQSLPDLARVHEALQRVPFVVVQDAFADTETAPFADLLLPAATFGEREGTSTNSERRITLSRAAVVPPGEARPDWRIAADFAQRLAARTRPERAALFAFDQARAVFEEYRSTTRGRDLDIGGVDFDLLEQEGPQQWPLPAGAGVRPGTARLYTDGRFATPDGRARFVPYTLHGPAEATDASVPLALTTVRLRDQWHGASRTGEAATLELPPAMLDVAPATLAAMGLADDDLVEIVTARGRLVLPVRADEASAPGVASVPMHFGTRWLPASAAGVNALTSAALDPFSRQPELKHAAARVARIDLAWHAALVGRVAAAAAADVLAALRGQVASCSYGAIVRFGRDAERVGIAVLAAHASRQAQLVETARRAFEIESDAPALRDARAGRTRTVALAAGRIRAALLEGRTRADVRAWNVYRRLIDQGTDCSQCSWRELFAPAGA
jgi:assimilatory nitrate reductase catalytic subunit